MHMDKNQFLQLLEAQQSSGLSIQNYCQQRNIPFSSFSYWKKNHLNYYHYYHMDGSSCIQKHV